jgi:hypothetical protein
MFNRIAAYGFAAAVMMNPLPSLAQSATFHAKVGISETCRELAQRMSAEFAVYRASRSQVSMQGTGTAARSSGAGTSLRVGITIMPRTGVARRSVAYQPAANPFQRFRAVQASIRTAMKTAGCERKWRASIAPRKF